MDNLQAVISKTELPVSAITEGHPDRAMVLDNLGIMLLDRYNWTGNMDELQRAISKAELAIVATLL